ncbi:S8 family serine peptidase [Aequorivita sediminis]|uniref:S8 family serine peptidase n=1 Tax=Aequorivita sediminis TaxID=3073653 RepID=UPI0028AC4278|nr:S8 family serine peptidase [Aequorivita sp. F6058]
MFSNTYIIGQNTKDYFLKIKQGHDLGVIQKTLNNDSTLTLSINNSSFANLINQKPSYKFEKPFLNLNSPFLDLVYLMTINDNVSINDILNRTEVDYLELIEDDIQLADEPMPFAIVPNDYTDTLFGGKNTSLDLIKAPLAWTISTGENVLIGVADTKVDLNHFDIPVIQEINQPITNTDKHGTGVVGMIAAKTNNGLGIASLAHNASIVSAPRLGDQAVYALPQIPGVKIINCSWQSTCTYNIALVCDGQIQDSKNLL